MEFLTAVATDLTNTAEATGMPGLEGLKNSLPYMGYGMVGIFFVTGVIILTVTLLNKFTSKK